MEQPTSQQPIKLSYFERMQKNRPQGHSISGGKRNQTK